MKLSVSLLVGSALFTLVLALLATVTTMATPGLLSCSVEIDGSGTHASIQAAVSDANCEFVAVGSGTFTENITVLAGRTMTIRGEGPVYTTVDGNAVGRVFRIMAGSAVTLSHMTIVNGDNIFGGGIKNDGGAVTILSTDVLSNSAQYGGAIHSQGGNVTISESVLDGNIARDSGGGIHIEQGVLRIENSILGSNRSGIGGAITNSTSAITITNSIINDNFAGSVGACIANFGTLHIVDSAMNRNYGDRGGCIFNAGANHASIIGSSLTANRADRGGAVYISWGTVEIISSTLTGNQASTGGAIQNGFADAPAVLTITHSTLNDNSTSGGGIGGGAVYNYTGSIYVLNSTFFGNEALFGGGKGGGIHNYAGEVYAINATFANNVSIIGSNIYNDTYWSFSVGNSIFTNNQGDENCAGRTPLVSLGGNLSSDATCNLSSLADMSEIDPMIGVLRDNGGPTYTCALLHGSPAIDAGEDASCPVTDQRGRARPQDGDNDGSFLCDIGAYEYEFHAMTISKSGPAIVNTGALITYTLDVKNETTVTLTNLVITDAIPAGANYIAGGMRMGNVVSWTVGSLAASGSIARQFVVTATNTITNTDYRVSADGGYAVNGSVAVVTLVQNRVYLPLVIKMP